MSSPAQPGSASPEDRVASLDVSGGGDQPAGPLACGFGQAERCGKPPAGAFATWVRFDVANPELPYPVVVVLCEEHWTTAPASWGGITPGGES